MGESISVRRRCLRSLRGACGNYGSVAALAAGLALLSALPAGAQQIYINSLWVSRPQACSVILDGITGVARFYCRGPADEGMCPRQFPNDTDNKGGNISNNPHIEFDQFVTGDTLIDCQSGHRGAGFRYNPAFAWGSNFFNYCNSQVMLCLNIGYSNSQSGATDIAIDKVGFELFKFTGGANALNPETTPPVRTFSIDSPGTIVASPNPGVIPTAEQCGPTAAGGAGFGDGTTAGCGYCILWDGTINIAGELGKSNGQYGFRGTVETNQTGANGNVNISQTRPYPSGATFDCSICTVPPGVTVRPGPCDGLKDCDDSCDPGGPNPAGRHFPGVVLQQPITVDVVNVHNVRSSATIVGTFSGVLAQPYSVTYRLGKDATTYVTVENPDNAGASRIVRRLVYGLPRVGEGIPDGTLQNGDAWNGRYENGDFGPPGVYLVTVQAAARDQFGYDLSSPVTRQISLDPLQITDILVQPLTGLATSLAVLTYTLTEPATVYMDIYPPGTQFCNGLNSVNDINTVPDDPGESSLVPGKRFRPTLDGTCAGGFGGGISNGIGVGGVIAPVRRVVEQKDFRKPVVSFWDGRDSAGNVVYDGDYVFLLYGSMPSQNGFNHPASSRRIWTSTAKSGFLAVARGMVTISQVTPATTVIGSSPSVAGLNPFIFSYQLSREAFVTLRVLPIGGTGTPIKTLVNREVRPANFLNREIWPDGVGDDGVMITTGNYLVELAAADPFFPAKVTTTTALFQANMFRVTDVASTPLQSGSTENVQLTYQLSQTMNVAWNIYPPGTVIKNAQTQWPPCGQLTPSLCAQTTMGPNGAQVRPMLTIHGLRPGRLKITEFWDGRDPNGLFVPDGQYVFTLVAQSTSATPFFATERIQGFLTITRGSIVFPIFTVTPTVPPLYNSSATITLPPFELDYSVTRQSSMTIHILTTEVAPRVIRNLISGQVRDANLLHKEFWDARDDQGSFVTPGFYTVQAIASDLASQLSSGSTVQQTIAVDPLRIYDVAVSPLRAEDPTALISFQVSETMRTVVKIFRPGTTFDASANPIPPEPLSLVRRIVSIHPARIDVTETWDGRDQMQALVPDGNYVFKIVASTDITAIDAITGNVRAGAALAEDIPISEIPVVRGISIDPMGDFEQNTFIYPNPINAAEATFRIYVPIQSKVTMKIFNIAGELVYERNFGERPSDTYVTEASGAAVKWAKVNAYNRPVARGVYFVLIREDETMGARNVLQTIKKIIVQ